MYNSSSCNCKMWFDVISNLNASKENVFKSYLIFYNILYLSSNWYCKIFHNSVKRHCNCINVFYCLNKVLNLLEKGHFFPRFETLTHIRLS